MNTNLKNPKVQALHLARARVCQALAHPTRLFIIEQLARKERCVRDLTTMIGDDMSTVSKHLSVLKKEGIIEDDKRGLQVYYRLACPCILDYFHCIERVMHIRIGKQQATLKGA
ncbi:MAG: metalloregulator ArsR/SmtB family transcription factor [Candidatus Sumerlaeota bacterium]|nr:metalloregulator ArsR/SmtB family transcription factor [Candidatus Sumerlaeota bacterium]